MEGGTLNGDSTDREGSLQLIGERNRIVLSKGVENDIKIGNPQLAVIFIGRMKEVDRSGIDEFSRLLRRRCLDGDSPLFNGGK